MGNQRQRLRKTAVNVGTSDFHDTINKKTVLLLEVEVVAAFLEFSGNHVDCDYFLVETVLEDEFVGPTINFGDFASECLVLECLFPSLLLFAEVVAFDAIIREHFVG